MTIRIRTPDHSARLLCDKADSFDPRTYNIIHGRESEQLETSAGCGGDDEGFEQYNGGFVWSHPVCAEVVVLHADREVLGRQVIGLGGSDCSASSS